MAITVYPGSWIPYTPTLTASVTNPTGWSSSGRYRVDGKNVQAKFLITAGSGAGSGIYRVSLPVPANYILGGQLAGTVTLIGTGYWLGFAWLTNTAYHELAWAAGSVGTASDVAPWSWVSGNIIRGNLNYEAA